MNRAVSLVMELENNITEKVTCTFNKVWFKIRVYKKWLSKILDRSLYIVRIVISDTEQEGTRSSNSCNISGETIRSPGRCSFDNAHVKPLWTMKESPLPPSKINWKIYRTPHPPPLNWKRNLYTVQLEPVTPPSVHNIPVHSLYYQSTWNPESKKNLNQGYGLRRGVESKMFSLGSWKMDSAKEHRDYVCICVSKLLIQLCYFNVQNILLFRLNLTRIN